ncbi:MAG: hypothetical protein NE334_00910 [Lentisphaeraceae bacterium]|nr:hypothetical protein [Lentisphaeraceae bacterium]
MNTTYSNIFSFAKEVANETKFWSDERKQQAQENIRAIESTYTDEKYLAKTRVYFSERKK